MIPKIKLIYSILIPSQNYQANPKKSEFDQQIRYIPISSPGIYILSLNYFLACKRMKPQKNFFFRGWTFFPETIGRSVVQPRLQAEAIQADRRSRKKSPTSEKKVLLWFHSFAGQKIVQRQNIYSTMPPRLLIMPLSSWHLNKLSALKFNLVLTYKQKSSIF